MSGTKQGAEKRRQTLIQKFGSVEAYQQWQREQAAKGGVKAGGQTSTNFKNNRELAARAGRIGGRKSKRKPAPLAQETIRANVDQPEPIQQAQVAVEHR